MLSKVHTYSVVVLLLLAGGGIFTQSIAQKKDKPVFVRPVYRIDTPVVYKKYVPAKKVIFEPTDENLFRDVVDRALNDRVQDLDLSVLDAAGKPIIKLHMEAYLGAPESFDAVRIIGNPPLSMKLSGGVHGDVATASIVVNSIPKVIQAAPGLRTMRDMVLPAYFGG